MQKFIIATGCSMQGEVPRQL